MKKKKLISMALVLCMTGGLLLSGCSDAKEPGSGSSAPSSAGTETPEPSESGSGSAEKVTINYYAWSEGDYLQQIVDAYNAQSTAVEVKMTQVNSSDYDDKLITMLSGTNDIDVFNMRSGSLLANLAASGNLADISQLIADSGLDVSIYGTGFAETTLDNKFYALPYRASAYGLFYNKKVFDEKGVPYPDNLTWEEYAQLAFSLSEGEGQERFYGSYIPDWNSCPYEVIQMGSNLTDDDLTPVSTWISLLNRFYNEDNSHMSFTDMKSTGTDAINFFCNSGCAMYPGGEWTISDVLTMLQNNPQLNDTFELGIATVPQVSKDGEKVTIGGVSTFVGINSTSAKQEAAYDFISYLAGKEAALLIAGAGAIPAYIDKDVTAAFESAIGVDGASNILSLSKYSETLFIPVYSEITNIYMEELELYLIGEQSLEDTLKNFEERRAELAE